jgi:type VI protein secretion system component VasK
MEIDNIKKENANYNNAFGDVVKGIFTGGYSWVAEKDKRKGKKSLKEAGVDVKTKKAEYKDKYGKGWRKEWNKYLKGLSIKGVEVKNDLEPETEDLTAGLGNPNTIIADEPKPFYKETWFIITAIAAPVFVTAAIVFYKMRKK